MKLRSTITFILCCFGLFVSAQKGQKPQYAVVARFISYGAGVPNGKPVINFARSFEKKYKTQKIKIDTLGPRGREGEYGLGFSLQEITAKQRKLFIQQIKKVTKQEGDQGEIQYEENIVLTNNDSLGRGKPGTIKID